MTTFPFAPYGGLADLLLPDGMGNGNDGSHDLSHLCRVWKNAVAIQAKEGGDGEILLAATVLHDGISVEKNSPQRSAASGLAAEKASGILAALGWDRQRVQAVAHAIEAHSFSAGIAPTTLEAKILRDADRLDAIGAVGVARCFYVAGRLGHGFYDPTDPDARHRPYDDTRYAVDHFHTKLLKIASGFQTATGAAMARVRQERLRRFLDEFMDEI
ncbi:MAG: HD domain-containing protein [Inquilinaceae bacterium]